MQHTAILGVGKAKSNKLAASIEIEGSSRASAALVALEILRKHRATPNSGPCLRSCACQVDELVDHHFERGAGVDDVVGAPSEERLDRLL
jgi:hypothetical protein